MLTRSAVLVVSALCTLPLPVEARDTPTNATVLIRVRGTVRVAAGRWPGAPPEVTELRDVEIGTGSGFVVSADGYIVTNHHAIADDTFEIERQGQKVRVSVNVQSIEVQFPSDAAVGSGRSPHWEILMRLSRASRFRRWDIRSVICSMSLAPGGMNGHRPSRQVPAPFPRSGWMIAATSPIFRRPPR